MTRPRPGGGWGRGACGAVPNKDKSQEERRNHAGHDDAVQLKGRAPKRNAGGLNSLNRGAGRTPVHLPIGRWVTM